MNIVARTATRIETTVELTIEVNEINYRFKAIMSETPNGKVYVYDIHFMDKYQVKLNNSFKKEIRRFIKEQLEGEK